MLSPPALQRLRGREDVDDEIQEMYQEDRSEKEEGQFSVLKLFTYKGLRWQLISIIVMMAGQQLSGVNGVSGEGHKPGGAPEGVMVAVVTQGTAGSAPSPRTRPVSHGGGSALASSQSMDKVQGQLPC